MPEARRTLYTESAMGFRRRLKLLVLLFVGVLAGSFVVAGYLLARSARLPGIPSAVRSESDDELLASAARRLGKHETEQALVLYRRGLPPHPPAPPPPLWVWGRRPPAA